MEPNATRSNAWDWKIKMGSGDAADELTSTETWTSRTGAAPRDDGAAPLPVVWLARHLDVAARILTVEEALSESIRAGARATSVFALRRASGGLGALRDSLYRFAEPLDEATATADAAAAFVDRVYFWLGQLLGALEDAIPRAREDGDEGDRALLEASRFATLYALSHVAPLYDECAEREDRHVGAACARVHADVTWLAAQLAELVEA